MAGLKHFKVAMDPAIVRLGNMTTSRYRYFRWTPRTALITFNYMILVPFLVGTVAWSTEGKYNFRAKRRGDLIVEF